MKKSLFMLGLAVAAMTSCSNDELMEVNTNNVITFESHVNKGTRTVTNTTTNDLTKFYVFGNYGATSVFGEVDGKSVAVAVTKSGTTWGYSNPVPWTANNYKFAAYATTNESAELGSTSVNYTDGALSFSDVVANDANDIVAAATSVDNTLLTNATVNLTFKHLLSKVMFVITNGSDTYSMKVSNITFNAQKQGDCAFSNTAAITWTPEGTASALSFAGTTTNTAASSTFNSEDHIVIPNQTLTSVNANFTVEFYDAGNNKVYQRTYSNVPLALTGDAKWQPGYLYKYTGTASPTTSNIQFSVTMVEGWVTETPGVSL